MATEQDFINAINAADDWRPPALAFADWLRERGDNKRALLLDHCITGDFLAARKPIIKRWRDSWRRCELLADLTARELALLLVGITERAASIYVTAKSQNRVELVRRLVHRSGQIAVGISNIRPPIPELSNHRFGGVHVGIGMTAEREAWQVIDKTKDALNSIRGNEDRIQAYAIFVRDVAVAAEKAAIAAARLIEKGEHQSKGKQWELDWQAVNYRLQLHFGPNDWLIRQHRKELSQ